MKVRGEIGADTVRDCGACHLGNDVGLSQKAAEPDGPELEAESAARREDFAEIGTSQLIFVNEWLRAHRRVERMAGRPEAFRVPEPSRTYTERL